MFKAVLIIYVIILLVSLIGLILTSIFWIKTHDKNVKIIMLINLDIFLLILGLGLLIFFYILSGAKKY